MKVTRFLSTLTLVVLTQISGSFAQTLTTEPDCDALELVGKEYMVLLEDLGNLCIKVELYAGGKMYVDSSTCTEEFSSFSETTEAGVASFEEAGKWSGAIAFENDPSSTDAMMSQWVLDFESKTFFGKMIVPGGCQSPSLSPSSMPSTSAIPSGIPTSLVEPPSSEPSLPCIDTPLQMKFITDGTESVQDCAWVAAEDTENRCEIVGVAAACPLTCGTCKACLDPERSEDGFRFGFVKPNRLGGPDGLIFRDCGWVKNRDKANRCALTSDICRYTCQVCTIF